MFDPRFDHSCSSFWKTTAAWTSSITRVAPLYTWLLRTGALRWVESEEWRAICNFQPHSYATAISSSHYMCVRYLGMRSVAAEERVHQQQDEDGLDVPPLLLHEGVHRPSRVPRQEAQRHHRLHDHRELFMMTRPFLLSFTLSYS